MINDGYNYGIFKQIETNILTTHNRKQNTSGIPQRKDKRDYIMPVNKKCNLYKNRKQSSMLNRNNSSGKLMIKKSPCKERHLNAYEVYTRKSPLRKRVNSQIGNYHKKQNSTLDYYNATTIINIGKNSSKTKRTNSKSPLRARTPDFDRREYNRKIQRTPDRPLNKYRLNIGRDVYNERKSPLKTRNNSNVITTTTYTTTRHTRANTNINTNSNHNTIASNNNNISNTNKNKGYNNKKQYSGINSKKQQHPVSKYTNNNNGNESKYNVNMMNNRTNNKNEYNKMNYNNYNNMNYNYKNPKTFNNIGSQLNKLYTVDNLMNEEVFQSFGQIITTNKPKVEQNLNNNNIPSKNKKQINNYNFAYKGNSNTMTNLNNSNSNYELPAENKIEFNELDQFSPPYLGQQINLNYKEPKMQGQNYVGNTYTNIEIVKNHNTLNAFPMNSNSNRQLIDDFISKMETGKKYSTIQYKNAVSKPDFQKMKPLNPTWYNPNPKYKNQ